MRTVSEEILSDPNQLLQSLFKYFKDTEATEVAKQLEIDGDPVRILMEVQSLLHAGLASHLTSEIKGLLAQLMRLAGHEIAKREVSLVGRFDPPPSKLEPEGEIDPISPFVFKNLKLKPKWRTKKFWISLPKLLLDKKKDKQFARWFAILPSNFLCTDDDNEEKLESLDDLILRWRNLPIEFRDNVTRGAWTGDFFRWQGRGRSYERFSFEQVKAEALSADQTWFALKFARPANESTNQTKNKDVKKAFVSDALFSKHSSSESLTTNELAFSETFKSEKDSWGKFWILELHLTISEPLHEEKQLQLIPNTVPLEFESNEASNQLATLKPGDTLGDDGIVWEISSKSKETEEEFIQRAPMAFRRQRRAVTLRDWEEIIESESDSILLSVARDGFCRQGNRFGKGVQVSFLPKSSFKGKFETIGIRIEKALRKACPAGILFEVWLPCFAEIDVLVLEDCLPEQVRDSDQLVAEFLNRLKARCDFGSSGQPTSFSKSIVRQFRLNDRNIGAKDYAVESFREFAIEEFFSESVLNDPLSMEIRERLQISEQATRQLTQRSDAFNINVLPSKGIQKLGGYQQWVVPVLRRLECESHDKFWRRKESGQ